MTQAELVNGRLDEKDIISFIARHDRARYQRNLKYNEGKNTAILSRVFKNTDAPHNNTPVSYARKIINTVSGYMFKPGLIGYTSENDAYLEALKDIFYKNDEDVKSSMLGRQICIQGVGFELHYTDGTDPRFAKVEAEEMIAVYDYELEPNLIAGIRHYRKGKEWKVEVYYADSIDYFRLEDAERPGDQARLIREKEAPHLYGMVPLVVYSNNEEQVGDFEPVLPLIDAYDILVSDSMNEFDRFAQAYLVLKGLSMKRDDAAELKQKRIFENVPADGGVDFLTKDIPSGYIEFMTGLVRKEIHLHP
jgi:SPP1 family phage portal protein